MSAVPPVDGGPPVEGSRSSRSNRRVDRPAAPLNAARARWSISSSSGVGESALFEAPLESATDSARE
jgi:hypothetical protein